MMQVGGRKVLMSETLFVPDGEEALIACFIAEDDTLNLRLQFIQEPEVEVDGVLRSPDARFDLDFTDDDVGQPIEQLLVRFFNFNKTFGQSFKAPLSICDSNKREPVLFFAALQKLGTVTRIDFQLMLGGA